MTDYTRLSMLTINRIRFLLEELESCANYEQKIVQKKTHNSLLLIEDFLNTEWVKKVKNDEKVET